MANNSDNTPRGNKLLFIILRINCTKGYPDNMYNIFSANMKQNPDTIQASFVLNNLHVPFPTNGVKKEKVGGKKQIHPFLLIPQNKSLDPNLPLPNKVHCPW